MVLLALNCGSSSVKYALYEMPARLKLASGIVDRVTQPGSSITYSHHGVSGTLSKDCASHADAINLIMDLLQDGEKTKAPPLQAVGHRVVHGGQKFTQSVVIDDNVLAGIKECSELAPLHNPANLAGIMAMIKLSPSIPNVAVFDTAFFTTMPPYVYIYALPYSWYEKYNVRKYGFHGTSHRYVSRRAAALLKKDPSQVSLISLHIGNGVSVTAVKNGVACDHSMGFTPLEGAVMGTRCGDIDPAIPLYIMEKENLTPQEMDEILNKRSGLLGITGKYADRREILRAMAEGDVRSRLSFEIECYRLRKYIAAYCAALGRVDAIVFTGGVGENSVLHRASICEGLDILGIKIDHDRNQAAVGGAEETEISSDDSRTRFFVIPSDEQALIAEEAFNALH